MASSVVFGGTDECTGDCGCGSDPAAATVEVVTCGRCRTTGVVVELAELTWRNRATGTVVGAD